MTDATYLDATRAAYDTVAVDYATLLGPGLTEGSLDRGMFAAFADRVLAAGGGLVADLGCGPGRVTAHLRDLGLTAFGIDLSPGMIAVARQTHPDLRFDVGSMTDLDVPDATLAGAVAWYSIIHTPPELMPVVFAEFHRVLAPGGHLLLGFHVGDERIRRDQAYGHAVSYDVYRLSPDRIVELAGQAGLVVHARLLREPEQREKVSQAILLARKPGRESGHGEVAHPPQR